MCSLVEFVTSSTTAGSELAVVNSGSACASLVSTTSERPDNNQKTAPEMCQGSRFAELAQESSGDDTLSLVDSTESEHEIHIVKMQIATLRRMRRTL